MAAIWMSVSLGFLPALAFGTLRNGMLMMVLCDREGRIYDVWISFGSMHEVRAFRGCACGKQQCGGSLPCANVFKDCHCHAGGKGLPFHQRHASHGKGGSG